MRDGAKAVSRSKENGVVQPNEPAPGSKLAPGLMLVATPIGNLGDITLRALDALRGADLVACEDSRMTGKLLALLGISARLTPYHEHNAERARPGLLKRLREGASIALVSDAGTPLLSDPGYKLVRACIEEGIAVTSLPGPSACVTALVLSGLPCDRFLFAGFLPVKSAARRASLGELALVPATLLFYESAQRLAAALADMAEMLGPRPAAVARELTKLHEEVRRATLLELAEHYRDAGPPKGEIVIIIGPPLTPPPAGEADIDALLRAALARLSLREAVAEVSAATGMQRRLVYSRALALARSSSTDPV